MRLLSVIRVLLAIAFVMCAAALIVELVHVVRGV